MDPRDKFLQALKSSAFTHVIGADEVGFGAYAGPVLVCACVAPVGWTMSILNDSKSLTKASKREDAAYWIQKEKGVQFATTQAEVEEIDASGLGVALKRCYLDAIRKLLVDFPDALVVIDGEVRVPELSNHHFPRADGEVPTVMAASIVGKVTRDRQMVKLAASYPGYGLGDHMGYGTPAHEAALKAKGMSPIHRKYTPMERILTGKRGRKAPVVFEEDVDFE